ncbi:hypothetical protein [Streptomyces beijiangensis]|uniref:Uncharacterized protein n=1 Tax=Streptomyces beijiangensis TaxID=163361 RepID=A0A939JI38_9ACTN|nr:hypothetical protein [Streptomyces beijiangensis]MBO0516886.1 hypothetical protein [Streptomyces beijiangensis]
MKKPWILLALPLLPLLLLLRLLLRRRTGGPRPRSGPPPAGVREPRRPSPVLPGGAVAAPLPEE